jgi:hypothetical protein
MKRVREKITLCGGEKIHTVEVPADFLGPGKEDGLPYVFEHAQLADLEEPHHAVGIDERNVAEVDLFRADEGAEGLLEGLFGKLVHRAITNAAAWSARFVYTPAPMSSTITPVPPCRFWSLFRG